MKVDDNGEFNGSSGYEMTTRSLSVPHACTYNALFRKGYLLLVVSSCIQRSWSDTHSD